MDFIEVTLSEKLIQGKKVAGLRSFKGYLLPISGIKTVAPSIKTEGWHSVNIIDSYVPTKDEIGYEVNNFAEVKLPNGFIKIINKS